jgi:rhodanese-related sulfurtransferase
MGFAFRVAKSADFSALTAPPKIVDARAIEELVTSEGAGDSGGAVEVKQVADFLDVRTKLFGQKNVTFVDARDEPTYEQGHIPGAVPLDAEKAAANRSYFEAGISRIPRDHTVVVYCSGGTCDLSMQLARMLVAEKYTKVLVYEGGFSEWVEEGGEQKQGTFGAEANP